MAVDDPDLLILRQTWPVSTIDGEPSLTEGTLVIGHQEGGGVLLQATSGDEHHPDNLEVQFPLSAAQVELVVRALGGERVGEVDGDQ